MNVIKRILMYLNDNIERLIIITSYFLMASIIFEEVIRRFIFKIQAAWSVQIPIYLFLILAWVGASYNAKARQHLRFEALRSIMGPKMKYFCSIIDYIAWITLATIVIWVTIEQVQINRENFSMVIGTEIMTWYFLAVTPIGWILIFIRVTQNLIQDTKQFLKESHRTNNIG